MPLFQAIILALVQALTEFLPVSSTAHLVLFPWLLHWQDPGEAFDVALHAGTLVAVLLYFWKDWLTLTLCGLGGKYPSNAPAQEVAQHKRLFWYMVIGTIPGAILGKLFDKQIEEHLRLPGIIGVSLVVVALIMLVDRSPKPDSAGTSNSPEMGDAVAIGTAQALLPSGRAFPAQASRLPRACSAASHAKQPHAFPFCCLLHSLPARSSANSPLSSSCTKPARSICRSQPWPSASPFPASPATSSSPFSCVIYKHAPSKYLLSTAWFLVSSFCF